MKKVSALLLALVLCVSLPAACSANPTPAASNSPAPSGSAAVSFTDDAGRAVQIPSPSDITKIAPSGSVALMYLMAVAPDLLGTTANKYADSDAKYIPPSLLDLPVVGQFYGTDDINYESIAAIGPQLVIDIGAPKDTVAEDMDSISANIGVPAIHITATTQNTPDVFRTLGKLLGREDKGEQLAEFCEKILSQTDDVMAKVGNHKANVLYCLGSDGLNVIANGSYQASTLDYVANNLAVVDSPAAQGTGNTSNLEQISAWNPDIILFGPNSVYQAVATDPTWNKMRAISSGSYYQVPEGPYNWMSSPPSINMYLGLIWLPKVLYPQYATYDLYSEVQQYYNLFYGYNLTQADFDALTAGSLPK